MHKIIIYNLFFFLIIISGCGKSDSSNEKIFNKYYYLAANICSFNGTLSVKNSGDKNIINYKISYNNGIGCKITKFQNKKILSEYLLSNNKINYTEKSNPGKTLIYNDSDDMRLKLGLPVNIGIDPYYFLETDMKYSRIIYPDKNTVIITYDNDKINLKAEVNIKDLKIDRIRLSSGGIAVFEVLYNDFRKLDNNTFFPEKSSQIFYLNGKEINRIESQYSIETINLCN